MIKDKSKVHYIPNGVNAELFQKDFAVGFVGSKASHEYKGLPLIQEACARLGVKLIIQSNEWPNKITPLERMPDFYREINCLAVASIGEGSNNPTLEALSMNIPVISTNTGMAANLEGVILVDRTVEDIMAGIRTVYTRKQILEKYTWKIIAKQYDKLYAKQ
jgi:glycosyltransferase involved in cell wall biosynthesis